MAQSFGSVQGAWNLPNQGAWYVRNSRRRRSMPQQQQQPSFPPPQKRARTNQYSSTNPNGDTLYAPPLFLQETLPKPPQLANPNTNAHAILITQNQRQLNPPQPPYLPSCPPPPPPLNHGFAAQAHNSQAVVMSSAESVVPEPQPQLQPLPIHNLPDTSSFPSLHAFISSLAAVTNQQQQSQSLDSASSGLISSLIDTVLMSLPKEEASNQEESIGLEFNPVKEETTSQEDPIGLEFDPTKLKVRHESVISALYADIPRQCTTCGCRFKTQQEHSSHMDWHVRKNRMAKQKNPKQRASRVWYLSANMWLTVAEALGKNEGPNFQKTETPVDVKDDYQVSVLADENQTVCALCLEPFEDFFSRETDDWMYKGTVYLNAPNGSIEGIDRSQLGPIVHARCKY